MLERVESATVTNPVTTVTPMSSAAAVVAARFGLRAAFAVASRVVDRAGRVTAARAAPRACSSGGTILGPRTRTPRKQMAAPGTTSTSP